MEGAVVLQLRLLSFRTEYLLTLGFRRTRNHRAETQAPGKGL